MKKSEDEYTYIALDLETTGLSPIDNRIIEIGAAKIVNGVIEDKLHKNKLTYFAAKHANSCQKSDKCS